MYVNFQMILKIEATNIQPQIFCFSFVDLEKLIETILAIIQTSPKHPVVLTRTMHIDNLRLQGAKVANP